MRNSNVRDFFAGIAKRRVFLFLLRQNCSLINVYESIHNQRALSEITPDFHANIEERCRNVSYSRMTTLLYIDFHTHCRKHTGLDHVIV